MIGAIHGWALVVFVVFESLVTIALVILLALSWQIGRRFEFHERDRQAEIAEEAARQIRQHEQDKRREEIYRALRSTEWQRPPEKRRTEAELRETARRMQRAEARTGLVGGVFDPNAIPR